MADDKDLQLLDQALGKFGIASDEQFPSLTGTLLSPLLEKLSSQNAAVRSKVRQKVQFAQNVIEQIWL